MQDFPSAVRAAEAKLGSKATALRLRTGDAVAGGVMFPVPEGLTALAHVHDELEAMGAYLFIVERGTPPVQVSGSDGASPTLLAGEPDILALLPTTDKFEVVRRVGTNGNGLHDSEQVLSWLRELDRTQPFKLVGVGFDFVEGVFVSAVHDPNAMARNVYTFCPDFWDQGLGLTQKGPPEDGIAKYFTTERYFRFWWD